MDDLGCHKIWNISSVEIIINLVEPKQINMILKAYTSHGLESERWRSVWMSHEYKLIVGGARLIPLLAFCLWPFTDRLLSQGKQSDQTLSTLA